MLLTKHNIAALQPERARRTVAFVMLFTFGAIASGKWPVFDWVPVESEARAGAENHVEFKQVSDTPIVYRAWGLWNFHHPASEVATIALDFASYPRIFHYVYRCERIIEPKNRVRPMGTYYVEGRAAIARVWSIGNIDTLSWTDSSCLRFFASQNQDRLLESKFGNNESGWLNYRTFGVRLAAFVVAAGKDSCRLAILAQGWVTHPMPQWLVRLGVNIILPQLLKDLENEVGRRADLRTPPNASWYAKMYHAARRFLLSNIFGPKPVDGK
jgi:hypothetical protein